MKKIILFICLTCLSPLHAQIQANQQTHYPIVDSTSPKVIKEFYYQAIIGKQGVGNGTRIKFDDVYEREERYDSLGRLIEEISWLDSMPNNDQKKLINKYDYDQYGNLSFKEIMTKPGTVETDIYQYDGDNLVSWCLSIYEDYINDEYRCASGAECYFNYEGQKKWCLFFDSSALDNLIREVYFYNDLGQLTEVEKQTKTDTFISKQYVYDQFGNNILQINFNDLGRQSDTKQYKYTRANQLILFKHLDQDNNLIIKQKSKYDQHGNKTRCVVIYATGKIGRKILNRYDDHHRLIERKLITYSGDKRQVRRYQYFYDQFGSLIRKVAFEGKRALYIAQRSIEYYN